MPARLVCPRAGPDGLVLGGAAPHLPRGALRSGAATSSARRWKRRPLRKPRRRHAGTHLAKPRARDRRPGRHRTAARSRRRDSYLRQARREIRGIDAPLASWRVEAVTATLLEKTAQPDSARRARQKYERALERLNRWPVPLGTSIARTGRPAATEEPGSWARLSVTDRLGLGLGAQVSGLSSAGLRRAKPRALSRDAHEPLPHELH